MNNKKKKKKERDGEGTQEIRRIILGIRRITLRTMTRITIVRRKKKKQQ